MNNELLFQRTKKLVATERRIGTAILDCLYEIDRRKAYAELRYDGLFTYCVKELGFTDAQAYQRVQAMRALKEIPELKPLIESGTLSVSAVAKVQTHFRREKKEGKSPARTEKLALFQSMENRTSREVETKLAAARGEKVRAKLVLEMDEELATLWEQAKNLSAHRSRGEATEVLKILTREWLERNDPARGKAKPQTTRKQPTDRKESDPSKTPEQQRAVPFPIKVAPPLSPENRRYIPASLRSEVWRNDNGKCTRCGSKHALEVDHIKPFALGGETERENLRLLCRSCNQFVAIRTFGPEKVRRTEN